MPCFGLSQAPLGAGDLLVHFFRGPADLLVDALQNLCQGKLDVLGDALDLGQPFSPELPSGTGANACSLSQAVASGRAATPACDGTVDQGRQITRRGGGT